MKSTLTALAISAALAVAVPPINPVPGGGNAYGHPRLQVVCTPGPHPFCKRVVIFGRGA